MPKKFSNFRMFLEYLLIAFLGYLLVGFGISIIGNYVYKDILNNTNQFYACLFIYWWLPLARMFDMYDHNKRVDVFIQKYSEFEKEVIEELIDNKAKITETLKKEE